LAASDRWRGLADLCSTTVRDTLGLTATYTPTATGVPVSIKAPYDGAFEELVLLDGVPDSQTKPVFDIMLDDLLAYPELGDVIELTQIGDGASTRYVVRDVQPGGQGTAKLMLSQETAP
jgi:hypothetical protein